MQSLLGRITIKPEQCGGRPCIRGMRIRVIDILDLYAAGLTAAQILEEMPDLVPEDLQAALLYAARKLSNSNPTQLSPGVETSILSEPALWKDWLSPEEDGDWAHLQEDSSCPLCTQLSPVLLDTPHWRLALNRNQNLLGKSMLVLRRHLEAALDLTPAEWADLHTQLRQATALLTAAFAPDHFNYAFLQNQDRHIHLHIIPRYAQPRTFSGLLFTDPDYPDHYKVPSPSRLLTPTQLSALAAHLQSLQTPSP